MTDQPTKHTKAVSALQELVRAHNLAAIDAAERAVRARETQEGEK